MGVRGREREGGLKLDLGRFIEAAEREGEIVAVAAADGRDREEEGGGGWWWLTEMDEHMKRRRRRRHSLPAVFLLLLCLELLIRYQQRSIVNFWFYLRIWIM